MAAASACELWIMDDPDLGSRFDWPLPLIVMAAFASGWGAALIGVTLLGY